MSISGTNEHSTGVFVAPQVELLALLAQLTRWTEGDISLVDAFDLVQRSAHKLKRACWCGYEEACCSVHLKHVSPHRNCIFR